MSNKFFDSLGTAVTKAVFSMRKNAPEIEFWGGLGLVVAGTGLAIYQSVKRVPEIKQEIRIMKKDLEIKQVMVGMSEQEVKKEKGKIIRTEFKNYIKAYALPAALVSGGITSEIFGFLGEKARYTAAAAEAAATAAAFASYRKRNAELIGEDKEKALYYGMDVKKVKKKVYDEDGNVVGTETSYELVEKEQVPLNPYTYEWSNRTTDACRPEADMREYNAALMKSFQAEWQQNFEDSKVIFLLDVLRAIGLESEARLCSKNAGWLNPKYFRTNGDGYLDLRATEFSYTNEYGEVRYGWMINPNCDGDVFVMIESQSKDGQMAKIGTE